MNQNKVNSNVCINQVTIIFNVTCYNAHFVQNQYDLITGVIHTDTSLIVGMKKMSRFLVCCIVLVSNLLITFMETTAEGELHYIQEGKDCGNFLDPCGREDDPPCCAPDFCLQGYCQNNTLPLTSFN